MPKEDISALETIEAVERFFRQYQAVYGKGLFLEHALADNRDIEAPLKPPQPAARPAARPLRPVVQRKQRSPELQAYYQEIKDCQKCALSKSRKNFVFGYGNPQARVMFIGEAPGREEDEQGLPFVGPAGKLLDKMLLSIGITREEVFIANVLKCRPPYNRDPLPEEVVQCEPYLKKQIEMIRPKILVALGRIAAQSLLRNTETLSNLRSGEHLYEGKPLLVTYHPAALLRNPRWKAQSWEDLKKLKRLLASL